ncbi:MAG: DHH family phosphoesterase [Anaerolineales bacterium]|nr:DHH family phosphoesterase [Anaerolineales bacterium]
MNTKLLNVSMKKNKETLWQEPSRISNDPTRVVESLAKATNIVILMSGPDNDSIGSGIVLKRILARQETKKVELICKRLPKRFRVLPYIDEITVVDPGSFDYSKNDLIVTVDTSNPYPQLIDPATHDRFVFPQSCPIVSIDHHKGNEGFADLNIWEVNISSTCELIFKYMVSQIAIDPLEATLLLYGISGDTGHFRWALSEETLNVANQLVKMQADFDFVVNQEFNQLTRAIPYLLKLFLSRMKLIENLGVSVATFDYEELKALGLSVEDYKQARSLYLSSFSKSMHGFPVGIFLAQTGRHVEGHLFGNTFENKIDLTRISLLVGGNGGGHFQASGFLVEGELASVSTKVLNAILAVRGQEEKSDESGQF